MAYRNYAKANGFIVDKLGNGDFTTITAAVAAATSGKDILIQAGTYTESFTLPAGVNLMGLASDSMTPSVSIVGTITMTAAGTSTISNVLLQTNSSNLIVVSGTNAVVLKIFGCFLNCTNATGISFTNSNASSQILINNSYGDITTTGIALFASSSAGNLNIQYSNFSNSGATTTANTASAGTLNCFYSSLKNPITTSGTAGIGLELSDINSEAQNVTALTVGGSGTNSFQNINVSSGTASAISVGASATLGTSQITVHSSNTNAITGAGSININGNFYTGSSSNNNVTTQQGGTIQGLTGATALTPGAGYLGEKKTSAVTGLTPSNNTQTSLTSIILSPGIWDITAIASFSYSGNNTASVLGISTANNTLQGNIGDQQAQISQVNVSGYVTTISVPRFRAEIASSTQYFLVVLTLFSTGAATINARISATRVG